MIDKVKERLTEFKKLPEEEYQKEFLFCLLTPQSNAQRCWQAVQELSNLKNLEVNNVTKILATRTRFHNTKAKRILEGQKNWSEIIKLIRNSHNTIELRNTLAREVNGYGLKEASHFLRNIGKSNNQIAILDRHILRNLKAKGIIEKPEVKSQKHYLEIEQAYLNYAKRENIEPDILDLLWWSRENGEIFK